MASRRQAPARDVLAQEHKAGGGESLLPWIVLSVSMSDYHSGGGEEGGVVADGCLLVDAGFVRFLDCSFLGVVKVLSRALGRLEELVPLGLYLSIFFL